MIKKLHFFAEYAIYYFKKYFLVVLFGLIAGSLIYVGKNYLINIYQSLQIQNQNIGVEGFYNMSALPPEIGNLISYGFTINNDKNEPELSPLITNLEILNDNHTYLFTFKNDLLWSNGQKFNAGDIILNIPGSKSISKVANLLEVDVTDPYSPFLSLLSKPIFYKNTFIGLGSYLIESSTFQGGYFKTITLISTANHRQKITYHFYSNSQELTDAYKLGEVDEISTDTLDSQLSKWSSTKITPKISTDRYIAVFLNTLKLDNKQLRQAIAYATPKTTDKNDRCFGPISPNSWAYNEDVKQYNFDPSHAQELLSSSKIDHINLIVADRKLLDIAENIKTSWEQILGCTVSINAPNGQIDLNNYDAVLAYGQIPADPDQYLFWHSTQTSTNITHLNNSRIDKLLEDGRLTFDQQARKQIYYDFQRYLLEESPAIFLKFPTTYDVSRLK